jgi:hypothetical protein
MMPPLGRQSVKLGCGRELKPKRQQKPELMKLLQLSVQNLKKLRPQVLLCWRRRLQSLRKNGRIVSAYVSRSWKQLAGRTSLLRERTLLLLFLKQTEIRPAGSIDVQIKHSLDPLMCSVIQI